MDSSILTRHLPLITPRIEFSSVILHSAPIITPRIDFATQLGNNCQQPNKSGEKPAGDYELSNHELSDHEAMDVVDDDENGSVTDSLENILNHNKKIPKPRGQPGRPGSGGYNFQLTIKAWGEELIEEVTVYVKQLADKELDNTKSYKGQQSASLRKVCLQAARHFPIVAKYQNHWPVHDMLKIHLKYTSERHKKQRVTARRSPRNDDDDER